MQLTLYFGDDLLSLGTATGEKVLGSSLIFATLTAWEV